MEKDTLNLYQLRVLAAVVAQGSISGAARSLGLTQPAVSAQIRHLRRFAGAPVLVREGRRVALTEAGRALYRYAEETLNGAEALQRELHDLTTGERDQFHLVGPLAYVAYLLPPLLSTYLLRHPTIQMSISEALPGDVVERVRSGRADIGLAFSHLVPPDLARDLVVAHLFDDDLVLIESARTPRPGGNQVSLQELARTPFVTMSRGGGRTEADLNRLMVAGGLEPIRTAMRFTTWAGTISAVRSGVGVAAVLRSVARDELARGELRVLDLPDWRVTIGVDLLCSPRRRAEHPSALFEDLLGYLQTEIPRAVGTAA